ncbi:MAG: hypothetical protein M3Z35_14360 [Nitrospirota bacterium]|nr:hypothetical protein [Nitrospirota bacterium]
MRNTKKAGTRLSGTLSFRTVACCLFSAALLAPANASGPSPFGGEVPQNFPGPMMAPSIQALASVGPQTVYAGSFGMGVFRSEDRGHTWTAMNTGLSDPFILSLTAAPNGMVYVGTFRGGVFRTKDGGKSWESFNSGLKRLEVKSLLVKQGVLYAGTGDGLYSRSLEGMSEWTVVTKGLDDVLVHAIAMAPDHTLYVGTSGKGILRYAPRADEWQRVTHGLMDHEGLRENFVRVLTIDKDQALYAGTFDGGVFRSGDAGVTWRAISRALPNDSIRGIVLYENSLYVGTGHGIFKTMNQGGVWAPINKGLTEMSIQALIAGESGVLYAGTNSGAFRSDDGGTTWANISDGFQAEQK